jgi:hypothetical protein
MQSPLDLIDGDVDYDRAGQSAGSFRSAILRLPKAGEVLIGKFVVIPDGSRRPYLPAPYYDFMVGDDPTKDGRSHFSLKMVQADCPKDAVYWAQMKARKKLKEEGKQDTREYKRAEALIAANRPKTGALLLFVEKGQKTVKPLFIKEQMIQELFGVKDHWQKPDSPGLFRKLKEEGHSPYDMRSSTGWIKLYKSGSGKDTKFNAELDQHSTEAVINGKTVKVRAPTEHEVDPAIIEMIKGGKLPDLITLASDPKEMWTNDECEDYAKNLTIPDRFKKNSKAAAVVRSSPVAEENDLLSGDYADAADEVTQAVVAPKAKAAPVQKVSSSDDFDDLF